MEVTNQTLRLGPRASCIQSENGYSNTERIANISYCSLFCKERYRGREALVGEVSPVLKNLKTWTSQTSTWLFRVVISRGSIAEMVTNPERIGTTRRRTRFLRLGHSRIFASGNCAGRYRSLASFLGDHPFPPPLYSSAAPTQRHVTLIDSQNLARASDILRKNTSTLPNVQVAQPRCLPVPSLVLSADGALQERSSIVLIAPPLLDLKSEKQLLVGVCPASTDTLTSWYATRTAFLLAGEYRPHLQAAKDCCRVRAALLERGDEGTVGWQPATRQKVDRRGRHTEPLDTRSPPLFSPFFGHLSACVKRRPNSSLSTSGDALSVRGAEGTVGWQPATRQKVGRRGQAHRAAGHALTALLQPILRPFVGMCEVLYRRRLLMCHRREASTKQQSFHVRRRTQSAPHLHYSRHRGGGAPFDPNRIQRWVSKQYGYNIESLGKLCRLEHEDRVTAYPAEGTRWRVVASEFDSSLVAPIVDNTLTGLYCNMSLTCAADLGMPRTSGRNRTENRLNARAGRNGRSTRKPANKWHSPARFPSAKIRERSNRELNPVRLAEYKLKYIIPFGNQKNSYHWHACSQTKQRLLMRTPAAHASQMPSLANKMSGSRSSISTWLRIRQPHYRRKISYHSVRHQTEDPLPEPSAANQRMSAHTSKEQLRHSVSMHCSIYREQRLSYLPYLNLSSLLLFSSLGQGIEIHSIRAASAKRTGSDRSKGEVTQRQQRAARGRTMVVVELRLTSRAGDRDSPTFGPWQTTCERATTLPPLLPTALVAADPFCIFRGAVSHVGEGRPRRISSRPRAAEAGGKSTSASAHGAGYVMRPRAAKQTPESRPSLPFLSFLALDKILLPSPTIPRGMCQVMERRTRYRATFTYNNDKVTVEILSEERTARQETGKE
ncbi:hypothetical protein PR048_014344 [Dryococelus australis]|uniref:Uncharacterized protein n=1 Tax=Dryococelus australis TaxID=614101 RepID=A0ABQ9HEQ4_9NEOP|nr:hypothetical protein PR048_014344 [Dryococelus australis]